MLARVGLVGMPNVGKTVLFNTLTGHYQRVANFPGITVEKKIGWINYQDKKNLEIVDLPGLYSLDATSFEETVTRDFILNGSDKKIDFYLVVIDTTNLEKSLFLAYQLMDLKLPFVLALNLVDLSKKRGLRLDLEKFKQEFKTEVTEVSATLGSGTQDLVNQMISFNKLKPINRNINPTELSHLRSQGYVKGIFTRIDSFLSHAVISPLGEDKLTKRIDSIVLHPFWGMVLLVFILLVVFQFIFSGAAPIQDLIESLLAQLSNLISHYVASPMLSSLIQDGIIAGVGSILVFLPQILLLFLFIQILEDLGYLARASFLMEGFMRRLGLPGKAMIPLLSGHACAIPAIMSARIIDNPKERLITILILPLTTCSARLPVYTLLVSAMIPAVSLPFIPFFTLQAVVMLGLYLFGFFSALASAWVMKFWIKSKQSSMLLLEFPPYRLPTLKNLLRVLNQNAKIFITKAGTIIFMFSLIIWVLVSFPGENIEQSFAAQIGAFFAPIFSPLGFDWRITTALIPSIGAREIVVSALSMVLSVQGNADDSSLLMPFIRNEFTVATLMSLLMWFVFAPQCISTFAIIKRETQSYLWPWVMVGYTLFLAYFFSWLTYTIAS